MDKRIITETNPRLMSVGFAPGFPFAGANHGGGYRSRQIRAFLESLPLEINEIYGALQTERIGGFCQYLRCMHAIPRVLACRHPVPFAGKLPLLPAAELAHCSVALMETLRQKKACLLALDYSLLTNPYLADRFRESSLPLVTFPHNVECFEGLASREKPSRRFLKAMKRELDIHRDADIVICLSCEDAWFFRNVGCRTAVLPYYPCKEDEERFLELRKLRGKSDRDGFLILGSVTNPPTLDGMKTLSEMLLSSSKLRDEKYWVIGHGVQSVARLFRGLKVECLGTVTDAALDQILAHAYGSFVFQNRGSGALTRIGNDLVAGLPVLSNRHGRRGYEPQPGILCFESVEDLELRIQEAKDIGNCPLPIKPSFERLAGDIANLACVNNR